MKKRDIITIGILIIIFAVILVIMLINKNNNEDKTAETEFKTLSILTDENTFISIEKNINKIYSYASTDGSILSFIIKNEVNSNDYINKTFNVKEIYVVSEANLYKYFIKGNLYKEIMDEPLELIKTEYYILNYDMNTSSYNVEIIDEERYNNAKTENYVFEVINTNDYNRFEYSSLSPKSRAIMYFNDFINMMYSNSEEAYNLISSDTKEKYFNTYVDFENFVINHSNSNITLAEYSVNDKKIAIKDNYSNEYIFQINNILSYRVTINLAED